MKKTLSKAKNGKMVKTSAVDPEGNKIKQKTNTRTGVTKTVVKYSDPASSGKRREVTRDFNPGNISVYKNNPSALKEDYGTYKTGGMVNPNAKVSSLKSAGSKGVKSGVNPKASASKKATGRSGGTSTAPKTALPKAQLGRFIKTVGKGVKAANAIDAAADAAKTVKRANAAAEAAKAAKKTSGMKSFSDDISAAFERMERKALKEKLIAADKASKKKKGGAVIRKK